jgi:hypothetical protein
LPRLRELTSRFNAGIEVTLFWNDSAESDPRFPEFHIAVIDISDGTNFTLSADTFEDAKECYYHPFGVANRYLKSGKIAA